MKKNAIGYVSSVVIGVASTAPGYSLAAVLGFVVLEVGFQAPAIMIVSFLPMLFIAMAYLYMNRADPDCGTTFAWVTNAMGPWWGWIAGWAIVVADIIVMANLAEIAGLYTYLLFGWDDPSTFAIVSLGVFWIAIMTTITTIGIELSARTQRFLLGAELITLALFAVVALVKVYGGDALAGSAEPELSWFSPFAIDGGSGALVAGVLIGVFIYWGWDSLVTVNEETEDSENVPGRAAIMSTVILVGIYVLVSVAAVAFGGAEFLAKNADAEDALGALGTSVLGDPWDKLVIIAVLTSAAASTQTTILPTARTTLSMAVEKALPDSLGKVHPRFLTPHISTILMGVASVVWYVGLRIASENILFDSITALGLMIAFYYGLTGFACALYYRSQFMAGAGRGLEVGAGVLLLLANVLLIVATLAEWKQSVGLLVFGVPFVVGMLMTLVAARSQLKAWFLAGLCPILGGEILTYIFFKSCLDLKDPENSTAGDSWLGIGPPLVIGVGFLLLGVLLMVLWYLHNREFFERRAEVFHEPEPEAAPATGGS